MDERPCAASVAHELEPARMANAAIDLEGEQDVWPRAVEAKAIAVGRDDPVLSNGRRDPVPTDQSGHVELELALGWCQRGVSYIEQCSEWRGSTAAPRTHAVERLTDARKG